MTLLRALPIAAALLIAAGPAAAREAASCRAEIGAARAGELVRQCREVSPATRPPCNAGNRCALIRSEIRRGCGIAGGDAPPFCERHVDIDEEEDDEE